MARRTKTWIDTVVEAGRPVDWHGPNGLPFRNADSRKLHPVEARQLGFCGGSAAHSRVCLAGPDCSIHAEQRASTAKGLAEGEAAKAWNPKLWEADPWQCRRLFLEQN